MTTKNKHVNKGFYVSKNRENKAKKIITILKEVLNSELKDCIILDIGTGNGEIVNYLANEAKQVMSVDISNNRDAQLNNFNYLLCNEGLPFKNNVFDIIISNHVIEHVTDNKQHLQEIDRVLKHDGIVYLATPNRLWPWEVHYKLPLLHYLPQKTFINILKLFNRYHEDLCLLFWGQLKKLTHKNFKLRIYCDKVAREPYKYHMHIGKKTRKLLKLIPLKFFTSATIINPTFIIILRKNFLI